MQKEPRISDFRVSVNLPESVVDALKELAKKSGITMTEVLRKAILTEKLLNDEAERGNKILIEDKDKRLRQLVLR